MGYLAAGHAPPTTVSSPVRTREYLTAREIERLMAAATKGSRWGHRDATMILVGTGTGCGRLSFATFNGRANEGTKF